MSTRHSKFDALWSGSPRRMRSSKFTDADVRRFKELLKALRKTVRTDEDRDAHYRSNSELHAILIRVSGNRRLQEMYESLNAHLRIARVHAGRADWVGRLADEQAEHEAIVDAIERRDGPALDRALVRHIYRAKDDMIKALREREGANGVEMKIARVEAFAIRLPRDREQARRTAGSPTVLAEGTSNYRWSAVFPALYPIHFETALVKITTCDGLVGWGEAQAPLAPEVACTIIRTLLAPVLQEAEFEPTPEAIADLWSRMYSTMRVRGQTGGFMLDAISGIDIALWDLAGKLVAFRLRSCSPNHRNRKCRRTSAAFRV